MPASRFRSSARKSALPTPWTLFSRCPSGGCAWRQQALPSSRVIPLYTCPALIDPGGILSARHSAFRTVAFRPFHNVGFHSNAQEVILMTTIIHISRLNNTAYILAAPGSIPPLTGMHAGLLLTCRFGFSQEGLAAFLPLTFWITTTNFIRLTTDSHCLGFTSARGMTGWRFQCARFPRLSLLLN